MKMPYDGENNKTPWRITKPLQDVKKRRYSDKKNVDQGLSRSPTNTRNVKSRLKKMRKRKLAVFKKVDDTSSDDEDEDISYTIEQGVIDDTEVDHINHIENNNNRYKRRLSTLIAPMSSRLILHRELRKLEYMSSFFGCGSRGMSSVFRVSTALVWLISVALHFSFDVNEAILLYGHTFLAAQGLWLLNFVLCTWATCYRVLPWLKEGLRQLRRDECYERTITKVLQMVQKVPYITILFGLIASGFQHVFLHIDQAFHLDYIIKVNSTGKIILHVVRYFTSAHVYAGYVLFWLVPTTVMLMTGYSMAEFLNQFDAKIRDKQHVMSFKEAISSYSTRAKFVKDSSSKCVIALAMQLMSVVICFGLNTYVFLFAPVRRYLHVWHSIVPLLVMMYPLCCAAWVTKQYTWFVIVVVKAWVHRDDLDDDSDSSDAGDSGIDENSASQSRFSRLFQGQFFKKKVNTDTLTTSTSFQHLSRPKSADLDNTKSTLRRLSTGNLKDKLKNVSLPWQKEAVITANMASNDINGNSKNNSKASSGFGKLVETLTAAKAVTKFKSAAKRPRFNFEKFLSYLESMRTVVGFHVAGVMITWDKVSTTLFLLFSIIAVFLQESIFGSQKSTL